MEQFAQVSQRQYERLSLTPAPIDYDRSFFVETGDHTHAFVSPRISNYPAYTLPDLPETPVDAMSGLPLCFAPNHNLPPIPFAGQRNWNRQGEWNHQYPRVEVLHGANPALKGLGRMALLNLRWQWVTYNDHHEGYNPNFIGPKQPATPEQLASTIVMGMAGYIPEESLDFSGTEPKIRNLTAEERRLLWESGQVRVGSETEVRQYLFQYVFSQGVDHIRERELDEFLHTYNLERRIHLGHCLSAKIIERAVEPLEPMYSQARKDGLLATYAATNPRDFVKPMLTSGRRFKRVFDALHKKLGPYNRQLKQHESLAA